MKRIFIALLVLLAAACAAAEGETYYRGADIKAGNCYHATPLCLYSGGADVPLTKEEAEALGLYPCPVCVQGKSDTEGVRAAARGGTYVVRMSDGWMSSRPDIGSVFAGWTSEIYTDEADMAEPLARRVHGDMYVSILEAVKNGGSASAPAFYPGIYPSNNELEMCLRHIGGAWYTVLRPDKAGRKRIPKDGKLEIYLRFFGGTAVYEDGKLSLGEGAEWGDPHYMLKFEKTDSEAVFSKEYDGFSLTLYEELDAYVFVLREREADGDLLRDAGLTLGGRRMDISLNGYIDGVDAVYSSSFSGTDAVYAGVFSADEAAAVMGGAELEIYREPWLTEEDFQGTDYAIATKGTAGMVVVDRSGGYLIPPAGNEYGQDIYRSGNTFFIKKNDKPRSLRAVRIEDGNVIELACVKAPENGFATYTGCNGAVFTVEATDTAGGDLLIFDKDTGEQIAEIAIDESDPDAPTYSSLMGLRLTYVLEEAKPERLVFGGFVHEGGEDLHVFWLADNLGNRVSENRQYIEPLSWSEKGGLFLVSSWDRDELEDWPNDEENVLAGYDGREWFGEHWRCGIIDQDGNELAPCGYVKVTLLSATEALLEAPDGSQVTVSLTE